MVCAAALSLTAAAFGFHTLAVLGGAGFGFAAGWNLWRRNTSEGAGATTASTSLIAQANTDRRQLIEALITPALIVNADGRVVAHNAVARELFSALEDGLPLHRVSRHPGLLEAAQRARAQGIPQNGDIADATLGGRRLVATVSSLDRDSAHSQSGDLLIQFRDLSEQDRLAQSRSDFIANASHELRTPLASLKGFIETLQGPANRDPMAQKRFLGIMETQAARMARIIDDLLSLSRLEMQAHIAPQGEVDISALVLAVVQSLEPIAREANIALHLQPSSPRYLTRGDQDELEQVVQNLIENAIKYGKSGGKVEVSVAEAAPATRHAGRIMIAVKDDGSGIAAEHLPRLTERFYRVDTAASRERGGTGLGLAIVKHILNRHRGELLMTSTLGQGSIFTAVLPAIEETASV